ncbi:MAG TPA: hypothetical protein VGG14_06770 [Candidatus Sulfotelmatobacter sp.]
MSKWQAVHHNIVAFGIAQPELSAWEAWLSQQGILIELRKTWRYDGRRFTSATPMIICWKWRHRVHGASTQALAPAGKNLTGEKN